MLVNFELIWQSFKLFWTGFESFCRFLEIFPVHCYLLLAATVLLLNWQQSNKRSNTSSFCNVHCFPGALTTVDTQDTVLLLIYNSSSPFGGCFYHILHVAAEFVLYKRNCTLVGCAQTFAERTYVDLEQYNITKFTFYMENKPPNKYSSDQVRPPKQLAKCFFPED